MAHLPSEALGASVQRDKRQATATLGLRAPCLDVLLPPSAFYTTLPADTLARASTLATTLAVELLLYCDAGPLVMVGQICCVWTVDFSTPGLLVRLRFFRPPPTANRTSPGHCAAGFFRKRT
eukprot:scaffold203792_cov32-Prasinocladus_malaysianus.AAC.1